MEPNKYTSTMDIILIVVIIISYELNEIPIKGLKIGPNTSQEVSNENPESINTAATTDSTISASGLWYVISMSSLT